jgi:tetratricopeptide (TPR) repeat protein
MSLQLRINLHGEDHRDVADTYDSIAVSYKALGDQQLALEYFLKSLAIRIKLYGKFHADVA